MSEALGYFAQGGPTMWVLLATSMIALTVFIERMLALRGARTAPRRLLEEVAELLKGAKHAEAIARCVGSGTPAGTIFAAVLRQANAPAAAQKQAAEEVGRREAARLERRVDLIGLVAALGPLLGLLGTVLGMIKVFQKVNQVGAGSPVEMAAGIWEALVATAGGLLVGIPALIMYRVVLARIDVVVLRLEDEAITLVEVVGTNNGSMNGSMNGTMNGTMNGSVNSSPGSSKPG
jgi:biopolymer transport protein ExbB